MSRKSKTLGGIALVAFGALLLFSMAGASFARTRAYHGRMAAVHATAAQQPPAAESAPPAAESESYSPARRWHGHHGFQERGMGSAHGRFGRPFFMGGLFRILLFGSIGFLLLTKSRKQKHRDPEPVAKVVSEDVESEIRVGDEIGDAPDPDEMTVDDLLQAMKRLGIKKLEL